jgi:RHS repeat-associated protein
MYRGEQYDPDLGLYYLRARYYNSLTGRFLSRDPEAGKPVDPKTLHKYLYAGGDPVNRIDPSGRFELGEFIMLSPWMKRYTTQVSCEIAVGIALMSDQQEILTLATLGLGLGLAGNVPIGVISEAVLAAVLITDAIEANSRCSSIAWGQ